MIILSPDAERDLLMIARESRKLFGLRQALLYRGVVLRALDLPEQDPVRPASRMSDIAPDVRLFPLRLAMRRSKAASHVIYYRLRQSHKAVPDIQIVRILSERMDPVRRVQRALRDDRET